MDKCISNSIKEEIKEAFIKYFYAEKAKEFLLTEDGQNDLNAQVFNRYNDAVTKVVPWVNSAFNLKDKIIVEYGCGTGSSTAAFAEYAEYIHAYDIDQRSLNAAQLRLSILGYTNVNFYQTEPKNILNTIKQNHPQGVDVFLLYAVLEHLTIQERLDVIREGWNLLKPNGIFIVVETPNRLTYFDHHTSRLPFFHMLPDELALLYYENSTRQGFVESLNPEGKSFEERKEILTRWGNGISYHEFELALGKDYNDYIIADGYEDEIKDFFSFDCEDMHLVSIWENLKLDAPIAFTRKVLNFIIQKPADDYKKVEKVMLSNNNEVSQLDILNFKISINIKNVNDFINNNSEKKICIYGAGKFGQMFISTFDLSNFNVIGFIDQDPNKIGTKIMKYPIYSIDEIQQHSPDIIILMVYQTQSALASIQNILKDKNIEIISDFVNSYKFDKH